MALDQKFLLHVKGCIEFEAKEPGAFMLNGGNGNVAIIHFTGCQIRYGIVADLEGAARDIPAIMQQDYDEFFEVVSPGGIRVMIFST